MNVFERIIRAVRAAIFRDLCVALPGNVVSYDGSKTPPRAVVQLGVQQFRDAREEDEGFLLEVPKPITVPVMWPAGRGIRYSATMQKGDPVLVICSDRETGAWLKNGKVVEPGDHRRHDFGAGGFAIPMVLNSLVPVPTDAAALASKVNQRCNDIENALDLIKSRFDSHTHPGVTSGAQSTGTAVPTMAAQPNGQDVSSESLKLSS